MNISPAYIEVKQAAELLVKYGVSTQLIGKLYGSKHKDHMRELFESFTLEKITRTRQAELLIHKRGASLFSGSDENIITLRKTLLSQLSDKTVGQLYAKYTPGNNLNKARMITALSERRWDPGKEWALSFTQHLSFPEVFAGIKKEKDAAHQTIIEVSPNIKIPELKKFQIELKEKMLQVLNKEQNRTRCVVTLPTGGGKTRVAVEAFIEWMQPRFSQRKYLVWVAQSQELCEQAISCIQQVWSNTTFVDSLRIYRYFLGRDIKVEDLSGGVIVTSIQQLYSRIKNDDPALREIIANIGAMIIDEAHCAVTEMYRSLFEFAETVIGSETFPVCGLTATPGRNNDGTDNLVNLFELRLIEPNIGQKYDSNPLEYFREHGYLAKANHLIITSSREYEVAEDELLKFVHEDSFEEYSFLKVMARDIERNTRILNFLLNGIPPGNQILVYTCTVEHAELLAAMMCVQGRRSAAISSKTSIAIRRKIIEEFKQEKLALQRELLADFS